MDGKDVLLIVFGILVLWMGWRAITYKIRKERVNQ
jgi:hypothetical protein